MSEPMTDKATPTVVIIKKRFLYLIVITLLTAMFSPLGTIVYVNYVNQQRIADERQNDHEWCDLVVFYTDYYRENPPATDLQKQQFALMEKRRTDLGCK